MLTSNCSITPLTPVTPETRERTSGSVSVFDLVKRKPKLPKEYTDKYQHMDKIIGSGAFSVIKKCKNRDTLQEYAVKIVDKSILSEKQLIAMKNEHLVLSHLKKNSATKHIIEIKDIYETVRELYIIIELCSGPDLFDYIMAQFDTTIPDKYNCNEKHVAFIFLQLVKAIRLCHRNGIVHRDIKPENILFQNEKQLEIKLIDFGLSFDTSLCSKSQMRTQCGSPNYIAPEILLCKRNNVGYTSKCDWWSCGIILYTMLSGFYPFHSESNQELYQQIVGSPHNFHNKNWNNISKEAKDLINHLLIKDPKKRYTFKSIIKHPWIVKHKPNAHKTSISKKN